MDSSISGGGGGYSAGSARLVLVLNRIARIGKWEFSSADRKILDF